MSKKVFVAVTAILLAAAAAMVGTVFAQAPSRGNSPGFSPDFPSDRGWMLLHMAKELDLTADQQEQIKSIRLAGRAKVRSLEQRLWLNHEAHAPLHDIPIWVPARSGLMAPGPPNVHNDFDQELLRDEQVQLTRELIVERERTSSQLYALLTPEQRQKLQQLMQERKQKMRDSKRKR